MSLAPAAVSWVRVLGKLRPRVIAKRSLPDATSKPTNGKHHGPPLPGLERSRCREQRSAVGMADLNAVDPCGTVVHQRDAGDPG